MLIAFVRHQIPITTAPTPCRSSCLPLVFLLFAFYNIYNIKGEENFIQNETFFVSFRLYIANQNDMLMSNTLKNQHGGAYKPAPDIIKIRVRLFAENHFHRPLSNLRPEQRMAVIYCLHQQFQFSNGDITSLLSVSRSTIHRDLQSAGIYKNHSEFMSHVRSIEDYILYNAKYIH